VGVYNAFFRVREEPIMLIQPITSQNCSLSVVLAACILS